MSRLERLACQFLLFFVAAASCAAQEKPARQLYMPRDTCRPKIENREVALNTMSLPLAVTRVTRDWHWIGQGWVKRADLVPMEHAAAYYTQYVQMHPDSSWAYLNRGIVRAFNRQFDSALRDYTEAIRLNPKSESAYRRRGYVWDEKREYDKSIQDYSQAIRLNFKSAYAYLDRGFAWEAKGDYKKAKEDYAVAIRLQPKNSFAHSNMGIARALALEYGEAIQSLGTSIELDPEDFLPYLIRSFVWLELKEPDRALQDCDAAVRLEPKSALVLVGRGIVREDRREYAEALADYIEAIRLDPKDPWAYAVQAELWATAADPKYRDGKRAVAAATRAGELCGWKEAFVFRVLAAAYTESGDAAQAEKWRAKARAMRAGDDAPAAKFAASVLKVGKPVRASAQ
jgi:tetratricopeptide (TPR) repeat protein